MTLPEADQPLSRVEAPLEALIDEVAELRTPSMVASRVLQLTKDQRFSSHELARVISTDQALSAKLLRLANSPYYGFARHIATVRDAVVLLGFRAVRSAAVASCVIDALPGRTTTLDAGRFWHFSVTVGSLAELLGRAEGHDAEEAFTAGVLHNVGRLVLDQYRPEQLAEAVKLAREREMPVGAAIRGVLGFTDAEIGAALAERWNFPQQLVEAIAQHDRALEELKPDSLTALVVQAREFALARSLSDGIDPVPAEPDREDWLLSRLGLLSSKDGGMEGIAGRATEFLGGILDSRGAAAA